MLRRDIENHKRDQSVKHNDLLLKAFKEQRQSIDSVTDHVMPNVEKIVLRVKHDVLTGKEPFVPKFAGNPTRLYYEELIVRGFTTALYVETKDDRPGTGTPAQHVSRDQSGSFSVQCKLYI